MRLQRVIGSVGLSASVLTATCAAAAGSDRAQIAALLGRLKGTIMNKNAAAFRKLETPDFHSIAEGKSETGAELESTMRSGYQRIGKMRSVTVQQSGLKLKGKAATEEMVVVFVAELPSPAPHQKGATKAAQKLFKLKTTYHAELAKTGGVWKFRLLKVANSRMNVNGTEVHFGGG
ncbi:MAG: hypothetical protein KGJ62_03555 [Armatimonadetes bacterium]|nr:hypothetical protein [Armatimonadota bacterium]MDE2206078.1 hypothetical protein [Armatimonadota bacterium]